jgi:hypothetical protein
LCAATKPIVRPESLVSRQILCDAQNIFELLFCNKIRLFFMGYRLRQGYGASLLAERSDASGYLSDFR